MNTVDQKNTIYFEGVVQLLTELMKYVDAFTPSCACGLHGVIHVERLTALGKTFGYS
jgi:hypothetical protein